MTEFDWEQEGYERLHRLEGEVADLRREIAFLREYLEELEWELITPGRRRRHYARRRRHCAARRGILRRGIVASASASREKGKAWRATG